MRRQSGSQVFIFGVAVETVNGTLLPKREAQRVLGLVLGCTDRQARAIVSTWAAQGRLEPAEGRRGINQGLIEVRTFSLLVTSHQVAAPAASRGNGALSDGRPRITGSRARHPLARRLGLRNTPRTA